MKFTVIDCEQRSEAWFKARCGRLTGSHAGDLLSNGRGGKESAARRDLRALVLSERLTGVQLEADFDSRALKHGREREPAARGAWEAETGLLIQSTGFISAVDHMVGCSLDGHVGDFEGVLELKCPNSRQHLAYLRGKAVPEDYIDQLRHNVWLTGAKWGEFASFDDRFVKEELQLFRAPRMTREELEVNKYEDAVMRFLAEINVELADIQTLRKAA